MDTLLRPCMPVGTVMKKEKEEEDENPELGLDFQLSVFLCFLMCVLLK